MRRADTPPAALRSARGRIEFRWFAARDGEMVLTWRERGGAEVTPPTRKGFGTQFIERCVAAELHGSMELSFASAGVVCAMTTRL